MNPKQAKNLFDEIAELASQLEDDNLNDALESLYGEVDKSKTEYDVLKVTSELMFYVDECQDNQNEDLVLEIQELYNNMQDELE